MPSFARCATLAAVVSVAAAAWTGPARAAGCTPANVAGTFGIYGGGTALPGNSLHVPPGPFATTALIKLTAKGEFIILRQSISFNGAIGRDQSSRGVYTIRPDCTGTIDDGGGDTADLVFVDDRRQFYVSGTAKGLVESFVFTRVATGGR